VLLLVLIPELCFAFHRMQPGKKQQQQQQQQQQQLIG
jgi:preprotein translocase subunit YajC